jgi:hypothetical protein
MGVRREIYEQMNVLSATFPSIALNRSLLDEQRVVSDRLAGLDQTVRSNGLIPFGPSTGLEIGDRTVIALSQPNVPGAAILKTSIENMGEFPEVSEMYPRGIMRSLGKVIQQGEDGVERVIAAGIIESIVPRQVAKPTRVRKFAQRLGRRIVSGVSEPGMELLRDARSPAPAEIQGLVVGAHIRVTPVERAENGRPVPLYHMAREVTADSQTGLPAVLAGITGIEVNSRVDPTVRHFKAIQATPSSMLPTGNAQVIAQTGRPVYVTKSGSIIVGAKPR